MTVPLSVLAVGSVLAGWIGVPEAVESVGEAFRTFEHWLEPVFASGAAHAAARRRRPPRRQHRMAADGAFGRDRGCRHLLARYLYHTQPEIPDSLEQSLRPLHRLLYNKWYVDEIYDFLFVNGLGKGGGTLLGAFDRSVVDGGVNGAGWLTRFTSTLSIWWDTWVSTAPCALGSFLVKMLSYPVRILQTGHVQAYALFCCGRSVAFLRVLHGAVDQWTSTY